METTDNIHENSMVGRRIGVYELKREIGRGGMGTVFLAERADGEFYQTVAVKLIKRGMDTDSILKRFRRERQILAILNHPNIAYFLGGGSTDDGLPYFVMEYIEGKPLYQFCDEKKLSINERLRIFRQICNAAEAAHQIKVIHRDLKPSNILVKAGGKPKLLDFGIAKVLDPELTATEIEPTATQMRILTPEYASPEQVCGGDITPASDIYSLGVMLYELLTGHRPYYLKKQPPNEVSRIICEEEPIRPSTLIIRPSSTINEAELSGEQKNKSQKTESVKADLEKIILKTLRKNPSERYQSAAELIDDITNYLENRPVKAEYFTLSSKSLATERTDNRSVAILPFKILGSKQTRDTGEEFLGIGLADALVSRLSGVQRLVVRPTSSALPFTDSDPFQAGTALGVDYILDGKIRRIGNRIRVSAQLLSVAENSTSWARSFDAESADVLELEDSISEQVAVAVLPQITGEERRQLEKRGTNQPEAYQAYLRGRYFWNKFTDEYFLKAVEAFRAAIALDPNYALPHVGIADFYNWTAIFGKMPSDEAFPLAKAAARRALEIDDSLGEAYAVLAFPTFLYDWDWDEFQHLILRALELSPNSSFAHEYYSNFLTAQGRFEEAIAEIRRAEELDPLSPKEILMVGWTLYQTRNYKESVAKARKANEMEKDFPQGLLHLGNSLTQAGYADEGVIALQESARLWQDSFLPRYMLCFALVAAGRRDEARKVLNEMKAAREKQHVKPYFIAMGHAALGEKDAAFEWFEKAVEERNEWMIWFGTEPKLDSIRDDPRYIELLKRTNNPIINRQINGSIELPPTGNQEKSIAVLPFKFIGASKSGDTDDMYLSIGLADALTMRLSNIRRFIVRPISSVRIYAGNTNSFAAGAELGVEYVVEGNIRRVGNKIRVTTQLLDIKNNSTRWAEKFDEKYTDVLEFEDIISERVAKSLITSLTGEELRQLKKRGTNNAEAYEAYLRGRFYWNQFTAEGFAKALASYNRAVALAPAYALAYAGIADYYNFLGVYTIKPFSETSAAAKKAALKAISIDDTLAEGYAALGFATQMGEFDWETSENHLRRAIELNPNNVIARVWYCYHLGMRGQFDGAFRQVNRALELDPMTPIVPQTLNWTLYHARRYDEAITATKRLIENEPNYGLAHLFLSSVLWQTERFDEAIETANHAAKLLGRGPYTLCWIASANAAAGNREQALTVIKEIDKLAEKQYVSPYLLAMIYSNLKDKEKTFEYLNKAVAIRDGRLNWLGVDPQFDVVRDDSRFQEILRVMNNPLYRQSENAKSIIDTPVIAVLPLKSINFNADENTEDRFLGFGLADAIITRLTNIKRIIVRPTSSVSHYSAQEHNPQQAGRELEVDYVLDGNLRRSGERLRVSMQLLNIKENTSHWAEVYDEKLNDILEIEDSISERVAKSLITSLTGEERKILSKRGTENAEAYETYLRGRYYWNQFTPDSLPKALAAFEKAIELDPKYAQAYFGLADFYNWAIIYGILPPDEFYPKAEIAALRAIELDDRLGEAYASLALVKESLWNWEESEKLYQKSIELNPHYSLAHEWYSSLMMETGRIEEGLEKVKFAESLNPLSTRAMTLTAWQSYQARHYDEAIAKARQIVDLDKNYPQSYMQLGNALIHVGRAEEAVVQARKGAALMPDSALPKYSLCFALVAANRRDEAQAVLREIKKSAAKTYVKPYFLAMAHVALEEYDAAFEYFEKTFAERDPWITWFGTEPKLDCLRNDERFIKLFRSTGNPFAFK